MRVIGVTSGKGGQQRRFPATWPLNSLSEAKGGVA